jgi:hypothetical protein
MKSIVKFIVTLVSAVGFMVLGFFAAYFSTYFILNQCSLPIDQPCISIVNNLRAAYPIIVIVGIGLGGVIGIIVGRLINNKFLK